MRARARACVCVCVCACVCVCVFVCVRERTRESSKGDSASKLQGEREREGHRDRHDEQQKKKKRELATFWQLCSLRNKAIYNPPPPPPPPHPSKKKKKIDPRYSRGLHTEIIHEKATAFPTEEKAVTLQPYSLDSSSFRSRTKAFTPVLRESDPSITHDENVFVVRQLLVAKLAEATTFPSLAVYKIVDRRPTAVPSSSSDPEHSISCTPDTPLKLRERRPVGERKKEKNGR